MMDELVAFLNARYNDDEQAARSALEAAPEPWERRYDEDGDDRWLDIAAVDGTAVIDTETGANGPPVEVAEHFYRHRPARVLAELDAKRRIVAQAEREINAAPSRAYDYEDEVERTRAALWGEVLRLLALPYADHPDYQEAWRP